LIHIDETFVVATAVIIMKGCQDNVTNVGDFDHERWGAVLEKRQIDPWQSLG